MALILEEKPYSFSDIFTLGVPSSDLIPALGYSLRKEFRELPMATGINTDALEQEFREVLPYVDLNNEQTRRETLVSSVAKFIVRATQCRLSYEYPLKGDRLYGNVDYLLQKQPQVIIIEAKRDDMENGFNQLAAELIALSHNTDSSPLLGAITTDTLWQFALLMKDVRSIIQILNAYRVPDDVNAVASILVAALTEAG